MKMVYVYLKNLRKSWLTGIVPPLFVIGFVVTIALGFPSLRDTILDRLAQMSNPIYQAILGDLGLEGLGLTWQGALFMYTGGTMNIILLFVALFIPARLLSTEVDKNTLDIMLSFPIPRWRYLLEKFSVYLTYGLLFPISIIAILIGSTAVMNALYSDGYVYNNVVYYYEIDTNLVLNYTLGIFLLIFALGALSLLCASIFLESNKSLSAAGALILGQYFLENLGGLLTGLSEGLTDIQAFSLFHYFKIDTIVETGMLPLFDVVVVAGVGILALIGALLIFHKREFAV
jgi:ABC-type transport system involved in multi-copper enzyme maturation permease subunit